MAETRWCALCGERVPVGLHPCKRGVGIKKPVEKIEEGLKEVLEIAGGKAKPAKVIVLKPKKADKSGDKYSKKYSEPVVTCAEPQPKHVETPAQPEPKSEPICQPDAPTKTKDALTPVERSKRWRHDNPEKAKAYMRDYQKRRRALAKEGAQ